MKKIIRHSLLLFVILSGLASCKKNNDDVQPTNTSTVPSERHIALAGEDNMRDLGGYPSNDGKKVRFKMLYRSGELSGLTSEDLTKLNSFGIRRVIDLRTSSERNSQPDKNIDRTIKYYLSLIADTSDVSGGTSQIMGQIISGKITAEQIMIPAYAVDSLKIANWKIVFDLLRTGDPTLFHCTAGKDRAGMTSALILSALDVPRDTVIADFMKSNVYLSASIETTVSQINNAYGAGSGDKLRPLLGVEQSFITTFFQNIERQYGTVDNFLTNILEVDKAEMKKLYLE
ncbi:MAG: tyrosine-protein phosphatase [Sporocytophaga sp.]|uniref:tyrosine-protein phosphatase n=1 Tax=Sporocytophaga sp. TaxID=2231183 RepID=UPI001B173921|nr:tyrosine-protein phosphatase [Sporocytophaga sp.]MBO9703278.1 tyrosine-protein phosphatase [Sporocytophaga sp.]